MDIEVSGTKRGKKAHSKALPDTGCTQTIMSLKFAKKQNVHVNPDGSVPIIAADGKRMMCEGSARIHIHFEGLEIETEVLVSSVLKDELLISWHDLIKLEIVPTNFPHRMKVAEADLIKATYQRVKKDLRETVLTSDNTTEALAAWLGQPIDSDSALHSESISLQAELKTHQEPESYSAHVDQHSGPIDDFAPGTPVVIQDVGSHLWDINGVVYDAFQNGRCLKIKVEDGMILFRDRQDVRPRPV